MIFQSDRAFVIFSYTLSHGLLLLRSGKTSELLTRVDILFHDVRAMEMRCWFDGLTIEERDPSFLSEFGSSPADLMEEGNKVYSVRGRDWRGFIVGGIVSFEEDDGEFVAPSGLLADRSVP